MASRYKAGVDADDVDGGMFTLAIASALKACSHHVPFNDNCYVNHFRVH